MSKQKVKLKPHIAKRMIMLGILACAMVMAVAITQYQQELRSKANTFATATCTVNEKLVNSCRPWLGAYANSYPDHSNTGLKDQLLDFEKRIGKQVDVLHYYHPIGSVPLNNDEKELVNRENTYLLLNWKPVEKWSDAAGSNSTVNANIDKAADSIKSVAPKKIILILHHEPENDISSGVSCAQMKGSTAGSPKDYTDMWHNVRKRFDDKGVNNVVWSFTITGYQGWFCTLDALYPGDQYVDWIMFDTYGGSNTDDFFESNDIVYKYLTDNSNSSHNYLSKPWGIAETSNFNTDKAQAAKFWEDAKTAVETNKYPNIKLYTVFDSKNEDGDFRIGYDKGGAIDNDELESFKKFANSPAFSGTATGATTTPGGPIPTGTTPTGTKDITTSPAAPSTATMTPTTPISPTLYCLGACPTEVPSPTVDLTNPGNPGGIGTLPGGGNGLLDLILKFILDLLRLLGLGGFVGNPGIGNPGIGNPGNPGGLPAIPSRRNYPTSDPSSGIIVITDRPTGTTTVEPTSANKRPTATPTKKPSASKAPTAKPSTKPTTKPTAKLTAKPTATPTRFLVDPKP